MFIFALQLKLTQPGEISVLLHCVQTTNVPVDSCVIIFLSNCHDTVSLVSLTCFSLLSHSVLSFVRIFSHCSVLFCKEIAQRPCYPDLKGPLTGHSQCSWGFPDTHSSTAAGGLVQVIVKVVSSKLMQVYYSLCVHSHPPYSLLIQWNHQVFCCCFAFSSSLPACLCSVVLPAFLDRKTDIQMLFSTHSYHQLTCYVVIFTYLLPFVKFFVGHRQRWPIHVEEL